jgi:hypothetical protein
MSGVLKTINLPHLYYNFSDLGWGVQCLYIDTSDNLFWSGNKKYGYLNGSLTRSTISTNSNIWNYSSLNYCFYNGTAISVNVYNNTTPSKIILVNSTYPDASNLTCSWPADVSTNSLIITGCAIYNEKFYVVGSDLNDKTKITVMETGLSTTNPANPFNTTTPTFTTTYNTFTAASKVGFDIISQPVFTGACTFDTQGNLYITTYGSGVYVYPANSASSTTPSLFITSTNIYSTILYNSVYNIFYICKVDSTNNKLLSLDIYSSSGSLIKSGYATDIDLPSTDILNSSFQMCLDSKGNLYYGSNTDLLNTSSYYVSGWSYDVYNGNWGENPNFFNTATYRTGGSGAPFGITTNISTIQTGTNNYVPSNNSWENYSIQWLGYFKPDATGTWTFRAVGDDRSIFWIGPNAVSGYTTSNSLLYSNANPQVLEKTINLTANTYYPIRLQFSEYTSVDTMVFSFKGPAGSSVSRALFSDGSGLFFTYKRNILYNGDFYYPVLSANNSLSIDFRGDMYWNCQYITLYNNPSVLQNKQYVQLGKFGNISQTVNIIKTGTYNLSFYYAASGNTTQITVNGGVIDMLTTGTIPQWNYYSKNIDISSLGNLTVRFDGMTNNSGVASYISDVKLVLPGNMNIFTIDRYVCFKKDTQILTMTGYKLIQDLRKGDLVKTLKHGYVPIYKIGFSKMEHPRVEERIKDQLYKCSPDNYPELFEDLVLTGCHSILVDAFYSDEQEQQSVELNGDLYVTDDKYRLPVCLDDRASVYEVEGTHTIYHMALEHDDYYMNYGIYANGLLVESTSKRFMDSIKMTLAE